MRSQARRGVGAVLYEAAHDKAVIMVERVRGVVCVVLLFVVAPAVVAELVSEVMRYRCVAVE